MPVPAYSSSAKLHYKGRIAFDDRTMTCSDGVLDRLEPAQSAGDMSNRAVPDLVLHRNPGGRRVGDCEGERPAPEGWP